ncbi:restriction endonuclease [Planobispora rosea]|uniref:Restriction endonuclease n=1 Tax=Planobispora rosea TaxID=35762 RepID=A0A8J3WGA3_PLARO|nr:DEAD/DEAH box helicase family protein [Planobispora rosea]GGS87746.1 restriction endonuclease [Planobispora rosea]GIH86686.1 restriction endonuclease [Planobispora rosea]
MADRVIDNPIINSPYRAPTKHFRFDNNGITSEIAEGRRLSSHFIPVPRARKSAVQTELDLPELGLTADQIQLNHFVNSIRARVERWRTMRYPHVTPTTRRLLEFWSDPERDNPILFCQREAVETAIYLAEAVNKDGDSSIPNRLTEINKEYNDGLNRVALKMATGSGKTVVMAMLIAWQTLNKVDYPNDRRFAKRFLVVAPGLTIRDRLRVLLPEDDGNYYRIRDLVPAELYGALRQARIVITNFHAFQRRETKLGRGIAKTTKELLAGKAGAASPFQETIGQMVNRIVGDLGGTSEIVVLNDEAHHCYRDRIANPEEGADEALKGEDRKEAEGRNEEARVWFRGLQAVKAKLGVKTVYDLSATPFFLAGSGYKEATLFPWVVSDFALIDAIESGIVKIPRVPVDDNATTSNVTYLNLWQNIREALPKKGRSKDTGVSADQLPSELEGALHSLYDSYKKSYAAWKGSEAAVHGDPPPVFIVVCNNTTVSKMVFDWIGGWDRQLDEETTIAVPGKLELFSNVDEYGRWLHRPPTILVDSEQFESGELTPEFRRALGHEIEQFKQEYARRFPGRSADKVDDTMILREVMNTVGKKDTLGEHVRCVVSVSMLTEGWDANTVTHILGVRAFGTQLLCEQVVGRGLRRRSYAVDENGFFTPEYADVYGVPFQFIPTVGKTRDLKIKPTRRVHAVSDRAHAEITFPRLVGYRIELPDEELFATFGQESQMTLSTDVIPTLTKVSGIVGAEQTDPLAGLQNKRDQEIAFHLAKRVTELYLADPGDHKPWLFPQALRITKQWLAECVDVSGDAFKGMLLLSELTDQAARKIKDSILTLQGNRQPKSLPIFRVSEHIGSTAKVDFFTTKAVYPAAEEKSHVNFVVLDGPQGNTWEEKVARTLEAIPEVAAYVKNDHLDFIIPYTIGGQVRRYLPDFLVRLAPPEPGDELAYTLIVEVSGSHKPAGPTEEKARTAKHQWVPAVNNHGGFGRWSYCELKDPATFRTELEAAIRALYGGTGTSAQVGPPWSNDGQSVPVSDGEGA